MRKKLAAKVAKFIDIPHCIYVSQHKLVATLLLLVFHLNH